MPYHSSEIRWFSPEKDILWQFYTQLPPAGPGLHESDRTDYYLRTGLINTGVKIRQGRHEIKVKSAPDEQWDHGVIQHWVKWSEEAGPDILNIVEDNMLDDWIAVKKVRHLKKYRISGGDIESTNDTVVGEGCGVEFTEVHLPVISIQACTLGLEAFSMTGRCRDNLAVALKKIHLDYEALQGMDSFGYARFLAQLDANPGDDE